MFRENKTYLMGILNVTPDSFSDGNKYFNKEKAFLKAISMIEDGADIIDIGGESTRPGALRVSNEEELNRVCEVVYRLRKESGVLISIDTYKSLVAKECVNLGANIINDISGGLFDSNILNVARKSNSYICLTHNRLNSKDEFNDVVNEVFHELINMKKNALNAGVCEEKIILDPGIGFSKSGVNNVVILKNLDRFKEIKSKLLLGVSKKKFLDSISNNDAKKNIESTLAITSYAVLRGINIVRVHDVKQNRIIIDTMESIIYRGDYSGG